MSKGLRAVALSLLVGAVLVAAGCGGSKKAAKPVPPKRVTDAAGISCLKSAVDFARRCPSNPAFGKTAAQLRAEARAKAKAKAAAAKARAAAARRARVAAAKRAAAHAAYVAQANAWHKGFFKQDESVYWRWTHRSCEEFATDGCWHVEVITRDGCQSYLGVEANEYQGSSIVGDLLDNNGNGVPPKTSVVFELDAAASGDTASDVKITCD
jgi:hypothetical protein